MAIVQHGLSTNGASDGKGALLEVMYIKSDGS